MQVQIKFRRTGSNSEYGSFTVGDILRCDKALAEHYVSNGLAVYTESPKVEESAPVTTPAEPKHSKKHKAK